MPSFPRAKGQSLAPSLCNVHILATPLRKRPISSFIVPLVEFLSLGMSVLKQVAVDSHDVCTSKESNNAMANKVNDSQAEHLFSSTSS